MITTFVSFAVVTPVQKSVAFSAHYVVYSEAISRAALNFTGITSKYL